MSNPVRETSIPTLRFKLGVLNKIVRECKTNGDDRWRKAPPGKESVQQQIRRINERIEALRNEQGAPKPPPVVVGMQPARMQARRVRM